VHIARRNIGDDKPACSPPDGEVVEAVVRSRDCGERPIGLARRLSAPSLRRRELWPRRSPRLPARPHNYRKPIDVPGRLGTGLIRKEAARPLFSECVRSSGDCADSRGVGKEVNRNALGPGVIRVQPLLQLLPYSGRSWYPRYRSWRSRLPRFRSRGPRGARCG
jgi:hypothetical protein